LTVGKKKTTRGNTTEKNGQLVHKSDTRAGTKTFEKPLELEPTDDGSIGVKKKKIQT